MKNALILGGAGFIGGHLAKKLKNEGFRVRIVDVKPSHEYWEHDEICEEYIQGDLRDYSVVERAFTFSENEDKIRTGTTEEEQPYSNRVFYH